MLLNTSEVGSLSPIGVFLVVMLSEALAFVAEPQHLNGKRGARF